MKFLRSLLAILIFALLVAGAVYLSTSKKLFQPRPPRPPVLARPYGMAPVAFNAFKAACVDSKIHPYRLGQAIGDHPRSVGYHKQDGIVTVKGQRIPYTTAIDIGADDLDRAGIDRFLHNMTRRGFACWYREKGKWKGVEHIHAVYAQLPMKRQLRGQVRLFLRERRAKGIRPLAWEKRVKRNGFAMIYLKGK